MLVHEANPAYALPGGQSMANSLRKAGFLVSFSSFMDETAAMADLILPASYSFEGFDDSYTPYGSAKGTYLATAPVIGPVNDTKTAGDIILAVADELGLGLGLESFEEVLQARAENLGADWSGLLEDGEAWTSERTAFQFFLSMWKVPFDADLGKKGADGQLVLAPVVKLNIGSAKMATPPFNVLTISERELQGQDCFVAMNKATAAMIGVDQGSMVKIASQSGEMKGRVQIFEGVVPGAVSACLGFGHTAWDDFSRGKGTNACDVLLVQGLDSQGGASFGNPQITVSRA